MRLSIIVPTRNRSYAIGSCLEAIQKAILNASLTNAEIVVVDNGSEDNTLDIINEWSKSSSVPVKILSEPRAGVSRARNLGVKMSSGDLIAFTDDDCHLSKDYVIDLLRYDEGDSALILRGGRIELGDPTDLPLTIKTTNNVERWNKKMNSAHYSHLGGVISSCNMAMRRELYLTIGQFDERFGPGTNIPASEDTDYICRAYLAGMTIEYVPDMTVFHYHGRKKIAEGKKLFRNYMIGTGAMYANNFFKDPNLCRQFIWDIKNAFKEIIYNKNMCLPEIDFSYKHKIIYNIKGVAIYLAMRVKTLFAKQF